MKAYFYRNGVIQIGDTVPEGALPLGEGTKEQLEKAVQWIGRLEYDNKTWLMLVPGLDEEADDEAVLAIAEDFCDDFQEVLEKPAMTAPPRQVEKALEKLGPCTSITADAWLLGIAHTGLDAIKRNYEGKDSRVVNDIARLAAACIRYVEYFNREADNA